MRSSLLLGVLLCLVALCASQQTFDGLWTTAQIPGTFAPHPDDTDSGDFAAAYWGLSFYMNVTPDASLMFADHVDGTENGNNTDYVVSLESWPQVYTFVPNTLTFRLSINDGATPSYGDADIVWSPAFQLVTVTALDMSAMTRDPIWRFNMTTYDLIQPTEFDVALGVTVECLDDGDACTGITDEFNENITNFYEPELRMMISSASHHVHCNY